MSRVAMSLDWDFFFDMRPPEGHPARYDWGFSENKFHIHDIWPIRLVGDPEIEQVYVPQPALYNTFWDAVDEAGIRFAPKVKMTVADSHAHALAALGSSDRILHFDNHHDLGYGHVAGTFAYWWERLARAKKEGGVTCDCGDWLGVLAAATLPNRIDLWYPPYSMELGPGVLSDLERRLHLWNSMMVSMDYHVWDGGNTGYTGAVTVSDLFIARSGAWTPPWADQQFAALLLEFRERNPGASVTWIGDVETPRTINQQVMAEYRDAIAKAQALPKPATAATRTTRRRSKTPA